MIDVVLLGEGNKGDEDSWNGLQETEQAGHETDKEGENLLGD
jgi:hypothetical protein